MKKNSLLYMLLGHIFESKRFRLAQIINFSGVSLIVIGCSVLPLLGIKFSMMSASFYLSIIGLIMMAISTRLIFIEGGIILPKFLKREIRKNRKTSEYKFLKAIALSWNPNSAMDYYILRENMNVSPFWAVRWAGVLERTTNKDVKVINFVPDFVVQKIRPEIFIELWESGITDPLLAASFAKNDIDAETAKSLINGTASFE